MKLVALSLVYIERHDFVLYIHIVDPVAELRLFHYRRTTELGFLLFISLGGRALEQSEGRRVESISLGQEHGIQETEM